ncbi:aromatic ring-hydroxylating dioxygenase subunit alpha [Acinetobacter baumannii]|uniref:aromatic ring-hydroxylating dioxygenase subunit alpha n=1 Tax=Acinetobacter baumannii TaxID=470 RepID=UPI00233E5EF0|nr:aromatic ring-hydroxylating dioxygenase subunit alpha [Acinetobacter baumannii]
MNHAINKIVTVESNEPKPLFPQDEWYVCALSKEISNKPLARTVLNHNIVLFRHSDGNVVALEDKCCHRSLALSCGTVEEQGIRCGYHGLLYGADGKCIEIPGQSKIPSKAKVKSYPIKEQNQIVWFWYGSEQHPQPITEPPEYSIHDNAEYIFDGDVYHYDVPYQLIHDNLMDLSHLGYVHLKTIGGNAKIHMNAEMKITQEDNKVKVKRYMLDSTPPPTYSMAYPFEGNIDRWQEIEFNVSHILIWTGAVNVSSESLEDDSRGGFHMRGFHGITPETENTCHYFWTMATNPFDDSKKEEIKEKVIQQTILTFDEDREVIHQQYLNMQKFPNRSDIDIHVDVAANRARKIIEKLLNQSNVQS